MASAMAPVPMTPIVVLLRSDPGGDGATSGWFKVGLGCHIEPWGRLSWSAEALN